MTKIRMAMVGGGDGAFIGAVHRISAAITGDIELVAGVFSADAQRSQRFGETLGLDPSRVYSDYQAMFDAEALLPPEQRIQFVAIVTPNHLHYPIAKAAIAAGIHVMSEKPATFNLTEALALQEQLSSAQVLYGLAHTYTGYPMVKEARHRVACGELGHIRKVVVAYPQGWLASAEAELDNKQASWRLDPTQAGISSCMGDIGVHAANLAEYISGLQINMLCADLNNFVDGRALDDDGSVLLRFDNGARGLLHASQICSGEENGLRIEVYGEKGGLSWQQQEPNTLWLKLSDRPAQMLRAGADYLCAAASQGTRLPMGHPEGYLEAFANLYLAFSRQIREYNDTETFSDNALDCPGIDEAVRGMRFIERVVESSNSDTKWLHL